MVILSILKDYGIQVAGMAIIIWLLYKITYNHLKHIALDVKEVLIKVGEVDNKCNQIGNRVSFLEGLSSKKYARKKVGRK
jgi:hypothetical protein